MSETQNDIYIGPTEAMLNSLKLHKNISDVKSDIRAKALKAIQDYPGVLDLIVAVKDSW